MSSTTTITTTPAINKIQVDTSESDEFLNAKSGSAKISPLHRIPKFDDVYEKRQWAKEHMAAAFRVCARLGWADGASGHISMRDPVNPEHFWINPYAMHFAMIKASDLILIDHEGNALTETTRKVNTAGFIIHGSIHKARPDINAAVHMHSPAGRAWSSFGKPIEMLNQDSTMFYRNLAVYEGFGGVVLAAEEGKRIADSLGQDKLHVILQNHGLLTCGSTVDEAVAYFIALERACDGQIRVEAAAANGVEKRLVGEEEAEFTYQCQATPACAYMQFQPEFELEMELSGGALAR